VAFDRLAIAVFSNLGMSQKYSISNKLPCQRHPRQARTAL